MKFLNIPKWKITNNANIFDVNIYFKSKSIISEFQLTLCFVSLAVAAPAPQEEDVAPEAIAYVHEEIAAEPYVHEEIEAEPYVHEEIEAEPYVAEEEAEAPAALPYVHEEIEALPYVHEEIAAEAYVHEEPAPAPVAAVAPVAYAGYYPFTYSLPVATSVAAKAVPASTTYAVAAPTYYIAAVKTGCINNVGSVVPCAQ